MARVDQELVRQPLELAQPLPVLAGVAARQVRAATSPLPDEQEVARQQPVRQPQGEAVLRMSGRVQRHHRHVPDHHGLAIVEVVIHTTGDRVAMHQVSRTGLLLEQGTSRKVIGMNVRVDDRGQPQSTAGEVRQVSVRVLSERIDQQRLVGALVRYEIRLAAAVIQLSEDHRYVS